MSVFSQAPAFSLPRLWRAARWRTATADAPAFVLHEALLRRQVDAFTRAAAAKLPSARVYYSVKTNDFPPLVQWMAHRTDGLEVVSLPELRLSLGAVAPSRVVLNGPNKTRDELNAALKRPIRLINLDSLEDGKRLARAAQALNRAVDVGIRITPPEGGVWEKFGLSPRGPEFRALVRMLGRHPRLRLRALHLHGSYWSAPEKTRAALELLARTRASLARGGVRLDTLDLGGGWEPCERFNHDGAWAEVPETPRAFERIARFLEEDWKAPWPTVVLEPGRALCEAAVLAVGTVGSVKRDRRAQWAYLDLSTGFIGGRHATEANVVVWRPRASRGAPALTHLCGPTCYGSDVFRSLRGAPFQPGERVVLANAGAYSMSLRWHGSQPYPSVFWVSTTGQSRQVYRQRKDQHFFDPVVS